MRRWLEGLGVGILLVACGTTPRDERPNLVLVVVDTLRADALTPYGAARDVSPELARWGEHGVVFERVLAQSSWTKSSMASLLTSLWPESHGVSGSTLGLSESATTLAESLRDSGYRTYAVQSNGWLEQTFGFAQGFDRYSFARGGSDATSKSMLWPHADNVYREASRLLDRHAREDPFFLYLHFMDVHEYASPPEHKRFGGDARGAYSAAIAWVDEVLARLRERLDDEGLLDQTILVLASDHGEAFGENAVHGHARNVLGTSLEVPLIFRLPAPEEGVSPRIAAQVRNLDIAPTLLELAGLPAPGSFEGQSLVPFFSGEASQTGRVSFASLRERLYHDSQPQVSTRDGRWTLVRNLHEKGEELLFDRQVDPGENVDLVEIEPERAAELRARLDAHLVAARSSGDLARPVRIDPALAQKLRALGYLATGEAQPKGSAEK